MSFLNKLASWPVFTLLLLILLTVPNIGLTATASLSHDGGSIWKVGGSNVNFNWTTNTDPTKRIIILTSKTQDPVLSHALGTPSGAILDTNANWFNNDNNNIYNPSPRTNAAKTGSFSWKVQSRYIKSGDPLSYPFYVRVLTLRNNIHPHNTIDTASSWLGPYRILRADACSLTTQVTGNGTITPATNTVWSNGQTKTVTFTPNAGHRIATAVFPQPYGVRPSACIETNGGACIPVATSGTGTLTKTLSCTTGAQYKAKVTFEAIPSCPVRSQIVGTGGKVTLVPAAPVTTVAGGQTLQVKAESDAGYKIKEFKLRGYDSWFTMSDATGKASSTQTLSCPAGQTKKLGYDVGFELNANYSITSSSSGVGGSITPSGNTVLAKDKTQKYTIRIEEGFAIDELKIDGVLKSEYTGETGAVLSGRDRGQTPKIDITLGYINETKNPRTISVKFSPVCKFITATKTLNDVESGKETWINDIDFRRWTTTNKSVIRSHFQNSQTCDTTANLPQSFIEPEEMGDISTYSGQSNIKVPIAFVYTILNKKTGQPYSNPGHAVFITNVEISNAPTPDVPFAKRYVFDFMDPNLPGQINKGVCLDGQYKIGGKWQLRTACNMKYAWSGIPANDEVVIVATNKYSDFNKMLRGKKTVRGNPQAWLKSNFTSSITNETGFCGAWTRFNTKAATLVKECVIVPSTNKTSFNTKEEISFLNKVAVKETITDKYLAQLALLWQIDDVMRGWWGRVMR